MKLCRLHALLAFASLGLSGFGQAQTFRIDRYFRHGSGVQIQASYDLTGLDPECCDLDDVRWIQRIALTDGNGDPMGFDPFPSDFIDPAGEFNLGTEMDPEPADQLPWYEFTYDTDADRQNGTNQQNGAGGFFVDVPSGWTGSGALSFSAETLLVCQDESLETMCFLGGFTWGFSINAMNMVSRFDAELITLDQDLVDRFNTSLDSDEFFSSWDMDDELCCDDPFTFASSVPEPSSMAVLGLSALALLRRRKSG